ncbi:MAG: exodeoxyribonuclease III [Eubacteriales bacterium]|nr:exodeoxyribonuclease III [Eubacteriales bacterium]
MRMISWNVNGLRAIVKKDFHEIFERLDADFFALQETKLQAGQIEIDFPGYDVYWNYADRKGYSGTCIFTRYQPEEVRYGIGVDEHDHEGRVITLRYPDFYFVTVYTPNSQSELKRLPYRERFEDAFRAYLIELQSDRPVIICGDLNVAHEEIDLANPESNHFNPGFSDQERAKFSALLDAGFIDSFRTLQPEAENRYSWWSYRTRARSRNIGWRIDYFVLSEALGSKLRSAEIHDQVMGSDHCPVSVELDIDCKNYSLSPGLRHFHAGENPQESFEEQSLI